MEKFKYGHFNSSEEEYVFNAQENGYTEIAGGEIEARKQLSYPLKEVQDYLNKTLTVKTSNEENVVQLGLNQDDLLFKRETENGNWEPLPSAGHVILVDDGTQETQAPQRKYLEFRGADVRTYDEGYGSRDRKTVVTGFQGPKGDTGERGPQGLPGLDGNSFVISGYYQTIEDLRTYQPTGNIGDAWAIGTTNPYTIYIWGYNGTTEAYEWTSIGNLTIGPRGPQGPQGIQGDTGAKGDKGDPGEGVPSGGRTGQLLAKSSDDDYAVEWINHVTVDQDLDVTSPNAISGVALDGAIGSGLSVDDNVINHANSVTPQATQGVYPITIDSEGHISGYGSRVTEMTPASHTHGYVQNNGTITNIKNAGGNDTIVITNSSNQVTKSNIVFDGSTTNQFLSKQGTWQTLAVKYGLQPNNRIYYLNSYSSTQQNWKATADCFAIITPSSYSHIWVDYVKIYSYDSVDADDIQVSAIPLKAGQTLSVINCRVKVYALY